MRVLLVEDETSLRKLVSLNLSMEGYEVETAENGKIALAKLEEAYYDIMILDLMLPKVSGLDVLTTLRLTNTKLPVIITSAKDSSSDRIQGLKEGADDYLVKPFEIEELVIRIQKLLERSQNQTATIIPESYTFGINEINFETFVAQTAQGKIELKQKELLILKFLIAKKNQVVSRQDILRKVWGYDVYPSTRTIDNFISNLRKHFEEDIKHPKYIISVRGIGYKFVNDND